MALKYIDGFEQYTTGYTQGNVIANTNSISSYKFTAAAGGSSVSLSNTYYRTTQPNSSSFVCGQGGYLFMQFPANETVIVGFGLQPRTVLFDYYCFCNFNNTANDRVTTGGLHFEIMANGSIRAINEATNVVLQQSGPDVITYNIWSYIEIKISFGTSANYELRVNGVTILTGTGVDTLCGLASVTGFNFSNTGGIGSANVFDDFYICDTTGTVNNDFLGPISVYTLFPSANGTTNNFTATGAASNYAAVNTRLPTTASYVQSGTTGDKDLYQVGDLPVGTGVVYGVQARAYYTKLDNGARSTQLLLKTSGTEANSPSFSATVGSWLNAWAVFEKQADGTTSWDIAAVNALEVGHKNT